MLAISRRHFYYNGDRELPRVYLGSAVREDGRNKDMLTDRRTVVVERVPQGKK